LGPWLILGIKMGRAALTASGARKHFGVEVVARCPDAPPPSCMVDGLQWGTGATYGKGNLRLEPSDAIEVLVRNKDTGQAVRAVPLPETPELLRRLLDELGDEEGSRRVWAMADDELFTIEGAG
jgi:formylmethanofuran dehydrogenase subunit E